MEKKNKSFILNYCKSHFTHHITKRHLWKVLSSWDVVEHAQPNPIKNLSLRFILFLGNNSAPKIWDIHLSFCHFICLSFEGIQLFILSLGNNSVPKIWGHPLNLSGDTNHQRILKSDWSSLLWYKLRFCV